MGLNVEFSGSWIDAEVAVHRSSEFIALFGVAAQANVLTISGWGRGGRNVDIRLVDE
jgi:hypothetical protein